ncbi:MAG: T9SS type A sorting domain-containing protein [Tunicatimonas sp.]
MKHYYLLLVMFFAAALHPAAATTHTLSEVRAEAVFYTGNPYQITAIPYGEVDSKPEVLSRGYATHYLDTWRPDTINPTNPRNLDFANAEEAFAEPDAFLYPNPTNGPFSLEINSDVWVGGKATLYNIIGEALAQRVIAPGSNAYDVSELTSGIYFINLQQGDQHKILRFMKR